MKKKQKSNTSTIILVALFFVGVCIMLYPAISDFWNEKRQSQAIINYDDVLETLDPEDYCTLVTCTPYGINTHRLLVRGTRIENIEPEKVIRVVTEAYQIDPLVVTPLFAAPMLGRLLIVLMVDGNKKNKRRKQAGQKGENHD